MYARSLTKHGGTAVTVESRLILQRHRVQIRAWSQVIGTEVCRRYPHSVLAVSRCYHEIGHVTSFQILTFSVFMITIQSLSTQWL